MATDGKSAAPAAELPEDDLGETDVKVGRMLELCNVWVPVLTCTVPWRQIILLGDSAVGKSKLVEQFMMNEFQPKQVRAAWVFEQRWLCD